MEIHTLARYISESSLQDYQFVDVKPALLATAATYLALRMKHVGAGVGNLTHTPRERELTSPPTPPSQTPTLQHYSGYAVEAMLPLVERLNSLIQPPLEQTSTVRSKYSHEYVQPLWLIIYRLLMYNN